MNLFEFEGKQILQKYGIQTPKSFYVDQKNNGLDLESKFSFFFNKSCVVKAQVLSGKRGKNNGILFCNDYFGLPKILDQILNSKILDKKVEGALVEEKIEIVKEYFISISYNSFTKQPVLLFSEFGGMEIEEVEKDKIITVNLDVRKNELNNEIINIPQNLKETVKKIWLCFLNEDLKLLEINPLVEDKKGNMLAVDAKIILDEDAFFRHKEWQELPYRTSLGREPTEREMEAKKIDEEGGYYRGTAGKYIEMDGNIAVLFSGGGASIALMDSLISCGMKPANYTEYSGNPPKEKVYKITKIVLSKPNLKGLIIVGGVANFTDIAETFSGIADALKEIKPQYPIVVRRAGPNEQEGIKIMQQCAKDNNLNLKIYGKETAMDEAVKFLAQELL